MAARCVLGTVLLVAALSAAGCARARPRPAATPSAAPSPAEAYAGGGADRDVLAGIGALRMTTTIETFLTTH